MSSRFRDYDLDQRLLLPPDLSDWLPEKHLARFIAEVVREMDLAAIYDACGSGVQGGRPAYHPVLMTSLLLYGYCTGTYSSRKLEAKTHEDVAFRFLAADQHPDHDSIAAYRKRHLAALEGLFGQILQLCSKAGLVKLGHVSVDGSKVKANASKHKAMSYERMQQTEKRLEAEVEEFKRKALSLLQRAEQTDAAEDAQYGKGKRGDELPKELARRESRLRVIRKAKAELEEEARARAAARKLQEQLEGVKGAEGGDDKHGGDPPAPPPVMPSGQTELEAQDGPSHEGAAGSLDAQPQEVDTLDQLSRAAVPSPKAQRNFTDPESRIMKDGATKGFVQAYNTQIAVDAEHQIIVAADVVQETNDVRQLVPMLGSVKSEMGRLPDKVSADAGYFSEENLADERLQEVDLYVPSARQKHGTNKTAAIPLPLTLNVLTLISFLFRGLRRRWPSVTSKALYTHGFAVTMGVSATLLSGPGLFLLRVPTLKDRMRNKLQSPEGHAVYARRKTIVEPVFGHIKDVRGFREFSLRGHANAKAEWKIVTGAHNLLKLFKVWARAGVPSLLGASS